MSMIPYHPAPGLGDLLPGFFAVPQNPIRDAVTVVPRIGDILPACFAVPQNPIRDYMSGHIHQIAREPGAPGMLNGRVVDGGVGGCGCGGTCGGCGGVGMGGISDDLSAIGTKISSGDIMGAVQSSVFGVPLWAVLAAAVALPMVMNQGRRR